MTEWVCLTKLLHTQKYDQLIIQQVLGRCVLSKGEKDEICCLKVHVKDNFFVLRHIPGQPRHRFSSGWTATASGTLAPLYDPRCWPRTSHICSPGSYPSLATLTSPAGSGIFSEGTSLLKSIQDSRTGSAWSTRHCYSVPYNDDITYMSTIGSPRASQYKTPQDMAAAMDKAVHAYNLAFPNDTSGGEDTEDVRVANNILVSLCSSHLAQWKMPPFADWQAISKMIISHWTTEDKRPNQLCRAEGASRCYSDLVNVTLWKPYEDRRHPCYDAMLEQAHGGTGENDSEPFVFPDYSSATGVKLLIDDHDPCPFHRRTGEEYPPFAGCCKSDNWRNSPNRNRKQIFWVGLSCTIQSGELHAKSSWELQYRKDSRA